MRKNLRILLSLFLAFAMSVSVLAANFKDVPANEWYTQYVNKAANAGIIKGYDDNTFRPKGNISFTEISSLLGNLVNVSEAEMQVANATYGKDLDALLNEVKGQGNKGIDWARPVILKCLQAGVYDLTTLSGAVKGKMLLDTQPSKRPPVSRSNTATFFADALKANVAAASLPYKDTASIPANIQTKVQALINIGILSKEGDGKGFFNPTNPIDRASIAKMITVAMDYIAKNGNSSSSSSTTVVPTPTPTQTVKNITGKVADVNLTNQPSIILIDMGSTNQAVYINHSAVVNIDGMPALYDKIEKGMVADITYNTSTGYATKATFKSQETVIEGKISSVISTYRFEVEYTKGSIVNNKIDLDLRDAEITVDGSRADVSDLDKNYEVKITMLGNKVKKVEAKRGNAYSDGTFYQFGYSGGDYYVDLYPNNSSSRKSVKIEGSYVDINDKKIDCRDLVNSSYRNKYILEGTPIKLKTNRYNEVTEITTVFGDVRDGVIQGYIFKEPRRGDDYIRVSPKKYDNSYDRDAIDLRVDGYTRYYINNSSSSKYIEDLRRDDLVKVTMKNGYVEKVEVDRSGYTNITYAYGKFYAIDDYNKTIDIDLSERTQKDMNINSRSLKFKYDRSTSFYIGSYSSNVDEYVNKESFLRNKDVEIRIKNISDGYYWISSITVK